MGTDDRPGDGVDDQAEWASLPDDVPALEKLLTRERNRIRRYPMLSKLATLNGRQVKSMASRLLAGIERTVETALVREAAERMYGPKAMIEGAVEAALADLDRVPAGDVASRVMPAFRGAMARALLHDPERGFATHDLAEAERKVDWMLGSFDWQPARVARELMYHGDFDIGLALELVILAYQGEPHEEVPDRLFWAYDHSSPAVKLLFFRQLLPSQTVALLRRAVVSGWSTDFFNNARYIPEAAPHAVTVLARGLDHPELRYFYGKVYDWEPSLQALGYFVEATENLLDELGQQPFAVDDQRTALWGLIGAVRAIEHIAKGVGKDPGNPCLPRLRAIEGQLQSLWPDRIARERLLFCSSKRTPFTDMGLLHPAQSMRSASAALGDAVDWRAEPL